MSIIRYTVLIDRYEGEQDGEQYHDGTDLGAREQLARELQEAFGEHALVEGFFNVAKRERMPHGTRLCCD